VVANYSFCDFTLIFLGGISEITIPFSSAFVDKRSKLMRLKMESTIIKKVEGKGIVISEIPPKKIKVKSQKE
jgi:hypothetical protein